MDFSDFIQSVTLEGRAIVPPPDKVSPQALERAARCLQAIEEQVRLEMPRDPPDFDVDAALWAALMFFRACQFATFRDIDGQTVQTELNKLCPGDESPAKHYSVDLMFRFLPRLLHFSKSASEGDVLNECLLKIAARWPLSSVGVEGIEPKGVNILCQDASLLAFYVDRILASEDVSRLNEPAVADAVRAALGLHGDLSPAMSAALAERPEGRQQQLTTSE